LDHALIFGEQHLRRVLTLYSLYYNETRTHLGLGKDTPLRRAVNNPGSSSQHQSCQDCITDAPGYDFREGQPSRALMFRHPARWCLKSHRLGEKPTELGTARSCPMETEAQ
jgi:hypothetical protein